MLLHRYSNIEYILELDADLGAELILKAQLRTRDDRIFQQWVTQLPVMSFTGEYVSYAAYKERVTGANIDRRSTAEILADIEEAERQLQEGGSQ